MCTLMRRLDALPAFVLLCASAGALLVGGCGSSAGGATDAQVDRGASVEASGATGGTGGADAADVAAEMGNGGQGGSGGVPADAALDSTVEHPADTCAQPSDCPDGTCWLQLNGARACIKTPPNPTLRSCPQGDPACCQSNAACAPPVDGGPFDNGRCLPRTSPCGGAAPTGNTCHFDECRVDDDCKARMPAGATVAICAPAGALGHDNAGCVYGGCRTDGDCTKFAGGHCSYALADTGGACVVRDVLFCAYPNDPCSMGGSGCTFPMICVPNDDYQGRRCGKGLPMFP